MLKFDTGKYAELNTLIDTLAQKGDWRSIEQLAERFQHNGLNLLGTVVFEQAETSFYDCHRTFDREFIERLSIDWKRYLAFYPDIQAASFSKLETIRHLCIDGLGKGRLSRYLIYAGKDKLGFEVLRDYSIKFFEDKKFFQELQILVEESNFSAQDENVLSVYALKALESFRAELDSIKELILNIEDKRQSEESNIYSALRFLREQTESSNPPDDRKPKPKAPDHLGDYGEMSENGESIVGRNGWIFINNGSNELMKYQTGQKEMSAADINAWKDLLRQRSDWHRDKGIKYVHLIVPNKVSVYPEFFPGAIASSPRRPAIQLQEQNADFVIYPIEELIRSKPYYKLYEKQNSHWRFWGCYIAYKKLCDVLGVKTNQEIISRITRDVSFEKGDIGLKHGTCEWLTRERFPLDSEITYDNGVSKYAHQGSIKILRNKSASAVGKKMVIVGDSFSNPSIQGGDGRVIRHYHRLSTLFAETLSEVHFVWAPWVDFQYIEAAKPDFVVTELAERFLVKVPKDSFSGMTISDFAAAIIKRYQAEEPA